MTACVANHYGETWTQLVADCAQQEEELFYDIVTDVEAAKQNDAGPTTPIAYAKQPVIAAKLHARKGDGGMFIVEHRKGDGGLIERRKREDGGHD